MVKMEKYNEGSHGAEQEFLLAEQAQDCTATLRRKRPGPPGLLSQRGGPSNRVLNVFFFFFF